MILLHRFVIGQLALIQAVVARFRARAFAKTAGVSTGTTICFAVVMLVASSPVMSMDDAVNRLANVSVKGCMSFSEQEIKDALSINEDVVYAFKYSSVDAADVGDVLKEQVTRGYLAAGFRDVRVTAVSGTNDAWQIEIEEGPCFVKGEVKISGLSPEDSAALTNLLTTETKDDNGQLEIAKELTRWHSDARMSFTISPEKDVEKLIREAVKFLGYPEAEFTLKFVNGTAKIGRDVPAADQSVHAPASVLSTPIAQNSKPLDLLIEISNTGRSRTVGQIRVNGLHKHTPEEFLEYVGFQTGMPLTQTVKAGVIEKLIKSGRFLKARVTHDPFEVGSSEPMAVQIDVRENDLVPPLGQPLTESQEIFVRVGNKLAEWSRSDSDFQISLVMPLSDAQDFVHSLAPDQAIPFFDDCTDGTCELVFWLSPHEGSLIDVTLRDAQQTLLANRSIVLTREQVGLMDVGGHRKWLAATTGVGMLQSPSIDGVWGDDGQQRGAFGWGFGFNSKLAPGLHTDIKVNPAALMSFFEGTDFQIERHDGIIVLTRKSASSDSPDAIFQSAEFQVVEASSEVKSMRIDGPDHHVLLSSGEGLLRKELKSRLSSAEAWNNLADSESRWSDLLRLVLSLDNTENSSRPAIQRVKLLLSLCEYEPAMKAINKAVSDYLDDAAFAIPRIRKAGQVQDSPGYVAPVLAAKFFPRSLFINEAGRAINEAYALNEPKRITSLLDRILNDEQHGALNCIQAALFFNKYEQSASLLTEAPLRLSREQFEHDVAPLLDEPSPARDIVFGLMDWVQQLSDDEVDTLCSAIREFCPSEVVNDVQITAGVLYIRATKDQPKQDTLRSLLLTAWDQSIRNIVHRYLMQKNFERSNEARHAEQPASLSREVQK